jgi:hypothetical protein
MSMNGETQPPTSEEMRQAHLATEALATDMARSLFEASQGEGENQVNFIVGHLIRLYCTVADLRAQNAILQDKLANKVTPPPEKAEVIS